MNENELLLNELADALEFFMITNDHGITTKDEDHAKSLIAVVRKNQDVGSDLFSLPHITVRLDKFMAAQPPDRWELEGNYWRSYHTSKTDPDCVAYSYIYRIPRIGGGILTGYMSECGEEYESEQVLHDSLEDMIEAEFDVITHWEDNK